MPISSVGAVPDVINNALIESDWGNAIGASSRGRVVHRFNSLAERDASIPAPITGMLCYVLATDLFYGYRSAAGWTALIGGPRDTYHASVARAGPYTCPAADAVIPFDTLLFDSQGLWVPAQTGFVLPVAGIYLYTARIGLSATGACAAWFKLLQNGTEIRTQQAYIGVAQALPLAVTAVVKCGAGDKLQSSTFVSPATNLANGSIYNGAAVTYLGTG